MMVLRRGYQEDAYAVQELLRACGMEAEIDPCNCLLADEEGMIVGLGRLEYGEDVPYLRPIAIAPAHQHRGVGRRLLEALLTNLDELRVVSRGNALGFYSGLGFEPMGWDSVHATYRQECAECPELAVCGPMPMRYQAGGD